MKFSQVHTCWFFVFKYYFSLHILCHRPGQQPEPKCEGCSRGWFVWWRGIHSDQLLILQLCYSGENVLPYCQHRLSGNICELDILPLSSIMHCQVLILVGKWETIVLWIRCWLLALYTCLLLSGFLLNRVAGWFSITTEQDPATRIQYTNIVLEIMVSGYVHNII